MQKFYTLLFLLFTASPMVVGAQDTTDNASDAPLEAFDVSLLSDASNAKVYCTQKVINQTPTRLATLGYEGNLSFKNNGTDAINSMGGLRAGLQFLAKSTNKLIVSIGANYWGTKINTSAKSDSLGNNQLYQNRMDNTGLNVLVFKPLDKKHFITGQLNVDASNIGNANNFAFDANGITPFGIIMYGWKKNDYKMYAVGISRTYRLGRPLFVPVFLYNQTFNAQWGVEMLLPARAHVRYNVSTTNMLLAGVELEGQQYYMQKAGATSADWWLQRGEIKPRVDWQKKLYGFIWLGAQAGYRVGYRNNIVDSFNGSNEITKNKWGSSPYFNITLNFVTP
jgi:Domain of unknown function (DUF6268)